MTKEDKKRTIPQNSALHLFFKQVADEFQDQGIEMKDAIPHNIDIPVTPEYLKTVFQMISKRMYGKEHTSDLTKTELPEVEKVFSRWTSQAFGISIPFPSDDSLWE